jgi:hypothetical protein
MYDAGKVVAGIAVLVVIATTPLWLRAVQGEESVPPKLELVTDAKVCVADTETMRTSHMELLNSWRDDAVRHGNHDYVAPDGTEYEKSLTRTCMGCHSNKSKFCDRCHEYAGVDPYCWDCHVEPEEAQ